ncbi:MarR family transcriptional regulator [Brevibacterium sp. 50QC2O2]|uniref:MarR family winged helix-turn-helix transcriptional regulator n=1 Tax=Brevibacterium TaxID=1696 RepID=UPI00211C52E8|nr:MULTISPECIES: MarR family transcriptional regulator [unclassified Brevibacterium]MCQ9367651.1 MarR family transcriptional regulator [Brevibacterium sp. 91QC2O2]MCQ9385873.1 MarR family transcriptional regulator [Brevibacterium sp. 68QC2CO]MCQ9388989.1 MarR family transcriptional regulator [Brevibacterium sp. 50QC2O2]
MESTQDEVDRIVGSWRREAPGLDVTPMEVLSRVSRLARQLDLARKSTFAAYGLELWGFDVLSALRRSGSPYELSPSALIGEMMVTSGTMTNRIDRLVSLGLVERRRSPHDRRGVLVRLTPAGLERAEHALADLLVQETALLDDLTPAQQAKLASLLKTLALGFERPAED